MARPAQDSDMAIAEYLPHYLAGRRKVPFSSPLARLSTGLSARRAGRMRSSVSRRYTVGMAATERSAPPTASLISAVNATVCGMRTPGSSADFHAVRVRCAHSLRGALHSVTPCSLFSASRRAMAVPQAPSPRTANLIAMRTRLRNQLGCTRNSAAANYYRSAESTHPAVERGTKVRKTTWVRFANPEIPKLAALPSRWMRRGLVPIPSTGRIGKTQRGAWRITYGCTTTGVSLIRRLLWFGPPGASRGRVLARFATPGRPAQRHNYLWLQDFLDDEVRVTADLYEVLRTFRSYRPSA